MSAMRMTGVVRRARASRPTVNTKDCEHTRTTAGLAGNEPPKPPCPALLPAAKPTGPEPHLTCDHAAVHSTLLLQRSRAPPARGALSARPELPLSTVDD